MPKISVQVGGPPNGEPVEFELVGKNSKGETIAPITFLCHQQMQGLTLTNLFQEDKFEAGKEVMALIEKAILPEYRELWERITTGDEVIVSLDALSEIAKGLAQVYTGNPTSAQTPSTAGSTPTTPTSVGDYLSQPEPTLKPSAPIVYATLPTQ